MNGLEKIASMFGDLANNLENVTEKSIDNTKESYLELNNEQLLEGKDSFGNDITPSYLDDPFFKSKAAAQRYSDWKDRITPNPKRRSGTPNLFIDGTYHKSRQVQLRSRALFIGSPAPKGLKVEEKFKNINGLSPSFLSVYNELYLSPELVKNILSELTFK